jgi:2-polyprenyl-3-methyl-5-hydroxy-6-metoxy-1,4-benzoquinol methylase
MSTKCCACQSNVAKYKDFLPFNANYLQQEWKQESVESYLQAGALYFCPNCSLWFRNPYPPSDVIEDLYAKISDPIWVEPIDKPYWGTIREIIAVETTGKDVLDIGCYMGDFLGFMPDDYRKFGIEPSQHAQSVARQRGITILGNSIQNVNLSPESFDAIVMLDVLEHSQFPLEIFTNCCHGLKKGGILILATGATETLFFQLFRQDYWYANISMHCTFYGLKWFNWITNKLPLEITHYEYFSAGNGSSLYRFLKTLLIKILYIVYRRNRHYPGVERLFEMPALRPIPRQMSMPWLIDATDQLLIILKKV